MKNIVLILTILLALLSGATSAGAELLVRADRSRLALGETLTLTISKEGRGALDDTTLQPLSADFELLGRSQSSSTQIINGSISSSFTLTLELAPKRAGLLVIPALAAGQESSRPLTIRVDSQPQPTSRAANPEIFLESAVEPATVMVQEQLIYTLRIYWAVEASIDEPPPPQVGDALLERVADAKYTKEVNGRVYRVFERKYAIFPQKSGVLEIPPLLVPALVAGRRGSDPLAGFFGRSGQELRLRGQAHRVVVRGPAPGYPAGAAWLPTEKLSAAAEWNRDLSALKVGEPVRLTIGLSAPGLLGAQLPTVALATVEGLKIYQDKAQVDNLKKEGGITGVRKESLALIPTRPGSIEVPEVRIPWWDKGRSQVAYAVLPARRLTVEAGPVAPTVAGGLTNPPPAAAAPPTAPSPAAPPERVATSAGGGSGWGAIGLAAGGALLLGGWLVTLSLLIQARRQLAAQAEKRQELVAAASLRERQAFKALAQACRDNDPQRARPALLAWLQSTWPEQAVRTGADLERLLPGRGLAVQLAELDRALYGHGQGSWQGMGLLTAVERIRQGDRTGAARDSELPPLYR